MPDEYITRDAVLDYLTIMPIDIGFRDIDRVIDFVKELPAADVEPVVRCRDCKYRDQSIPVHNAICTRCYEMDCRQGYGFCSMGARMEEDDGEK